MQSEPSHESSVQGRARPFDRDRFVASKRPAWTRLEALLKVSDNLSAEQSRELLLLYRRASSDLVVARARLLEAAVVDYLNDLVARGFSLLHQRRSSVGIRGVLDFFWNRFPRQFQQERRLVGLAALFLLSGALVGAAATLSDPASQAILIPESHQELTPSERVEKDAGADGHSADQAAAFSSFLFTHNARVALFVFALGITLGIGTALVLFFNGIPLGALAVSYHQAGQGLFFWAWILPHGIPELTVVCIAGAAGFMVGRGLLRPGRAKRTVSLGRSAKQAVLLLLGALPLLLTAGLIEGTISQLHPPTVSLGSKLAVAALIAVGCALYLGLSRGRAWGASPMKPYRSRLSRSLRSSPGSPGSLPPSSEPKSSPPPKSSPESSP